jgi:hypothetical protein
MTETEYTLDQFELDFEDASNLEIKREVLSKALDNFDCSDPIVMETLSKYIVELKDLRSYMDIEEDIRCNKEITSGELELYTCVKKTNSCIVGDNYYVRIDDVVEDNPYIWIYIDKGSLKKKSLFGISDPSKRNRKVFSEYFVKFENKLK